MANITFELLFQTTTADMEALAIFYGWTTQIEDANGNMINNPETKQEYAERHGLAHMKEWIMKPAVVLTKAAKDSLRAAEDDTDKATIEADVDSRLTLTAVEE